MRRAPATPSRRSRRRPAGRVPLALAVLALLGLLALLGAATGQLAITPAASTAGASAVSLVSDDGGTALFSSSGLSPGRAQTACVALSAAGSLDPGTEVSLSAAAQAGGLSPYLQLWVERGSVPAGGSCGAFTGAVIWTGTLAAFPATGTTGIATGWRPALTPRSVYRFTVTVLDDPRAQDLRTSATFRWAFTEDAPPPTTSTVPTTSAPPPSPAPPPRTTAPVLSASGTPTTTAATTTATTTADAPALPPPTTPPAGPPVPSAEGRSRPVIEAAPIRSGPAAAVQAALQVAGEAAQQVGRTAVAVARNGQFPVALIGVVAAFLFLQGRLDKRDPKLALALVREELSEFRDFPEPPPTEAT